MNRELSESNVAKQQPLEQLERMQEILEAWQEQVPLCYTKSNCYNL